jgi:hypothetical protein
MSDNWAKCTTGEEIIEIRNCRQNTYSLSPLEPPFPNHDYFILINMAAKNGVQTESRLHIN